MEYVSKWFSKVGRGVPQTEQVNEDGKPLFVDEKGRDTLTDTGNRKVGNEQYTANQVVLDSVPSDEPGSFIDAALEATEGDLGLVVSCFVNGYNKHLRLKAGGLDEYQKAARTIIKLMEKSPEAFPNFKGKSVDDIASWLEKESGN